MNRKKSRNLGIFSLFRKNRRRPTGGLLTYYDFRRDISIEISVGIMTTIKLTITKKTVKTTTTVITIEL